MNMMKFGNYKCCMAPAKSGIEQSKRLCHVINKIRKEKGKLPQIRSVTKIKVEQGEMPRT